MSRRFLEWGLAFLMGAAFLFITNADTGIFLATWLLALCCFFLAAITIPVSNTTAVGVLPDERQLPEVGQPQREWRFHRSTEIVACSGCGKQVAGGWFSPWVSDPINVAYGEWLSKSDDHFCADCAQLREQAEALGIEGLAVEYAAGNLTEERRDKMVDYLLLEDDSE